MSPHPVEEGRGEEGNRSVTRAVTESDFESAWVHWPKKAERKDALAQFRVAAKKIGLEQLQSHVEKFGKAYAATTAKNFIPALGVWLRRERWTDDLPTSDAVKPAPVVRIDPAEAWRYR